jgi:hypothetical protein
MEIEARQPTSKGPAERFTGDVWVDMVAQPRPLPHRMTAGIVRFAPGSRTAGTSTSSVRPSASPTASRSSRSAAAKPSPCTPDPSREEGPAVTWGDHVIDTDYQTADQALRDASTHAPNFSRLQT